MSDELGMLVLTMRPKERVVLRDKDGKLLASLAVIRMVNGRMRLGIAAPKDIGIGREERNTDLKPVAKHEPSAKLVSKSYRMRTS
jgi:sRNA-binding carbon storage regulator CsrA